MRELKITKHNDDPESASVRKKATPPFETWEEEHELVRRAQSGDFEALGKLAESFLVFIESIARQYQNQGLELPDLIEAGQRGFAKGLEKFDESRGFFFHSYVSGWIKKEIKDALEVQNMIDRFEREEYLLPSAPTTTFEEEGELVRRFKEGDAEAFEILIESFRGFVVATAKQYLNQGLDLPDLVKIGRKGLVKGIMSFDEKKGFFFRSWISWNIKESVLKALEDHKK